jgi:hypothetical protein
METKIYHNNISGSGTATNCLKEAVLEKLEKSASSIVLLVDSLTDPAIFKALLAKSKKGVRVEVIFTTPPKPHRGKRASLDWSKLEAQGATVLCLPGNGVGAYPERAQYCQFCVIDESTVLTGPYQYNHLAGKDNTYLMVIDDALEITQQFLTVFAMLRQQLVIEPTVAHDPACEMQLVTCSAYQMAILKWQSSCFQAQEKVVSIEKSEIERLIHQYNVRYTNELGDILQHILHLRATRLKKAAVADPFLRSAAKKAQKDYDEFVKGQRYASKHKPKPLGDRDQAKLKAAFRAASLLCHPDMVAEEYKAEAAECFRDLNNAYKENDLKAVCAILNRVSSGVYAFSRKQIPDDERLRHINEEIFGKLVKIAGEMYDLFASNAYRTICEIFDWAAYFRDCKEKLHAELQEEIRFTEKGEAL